MHRTDAARNVANLFVDKDIGAGTRGTVVDAAWLNAVQEEICNFIEGLGGTLVKGTNTQLLTTLLTKSWALAGSALQSILKGGVGGLDIGTSIAEDVRILLNNVQAWLFDATDGSLSGGSIYCFSPTATQPGVYGKGNTTGAGVVGESDSGSAPGVQATSNGTTGAVYSTNTGSGPAVYASASGGTGVGVLAIGNATSAPLRLSPQAAPSTPANGDLWVETGTNTLKVRINGVTKTVTLT